VKTPFNFIIEPKGTRYNNTAKVEDKDLILNSEIQNHEFVNREAIIKAVPTAFDTKIKVGDTVIVHHNVFRRWYNAKGEEKNSKAFIDETTYVVSLDQVFLYKSKDKWRAVDGFCFVKPIKQKDKLNQEIEQSCVGIVKYTDGVNSVGELVGFTPFSTYEFIIEGQKLYRVYNKFITIKYEYQGDEEEYNPSWA